jgi:hypothetical protein
MLRKTVATNVRPTPVRPPGVMKTFLSPKRGGENHAIPSNAHHSRTGDCRGGVDATNA